MKNYDIDKKVHFRLNKDTTWEPLKGVARQNLIDQLSKNNLKTTGRPRDYKVEKTKIPSLILAFYYIMYSKLNNNRVVSQEEYIHYYFILHEEWISDRKINEEGLKGRLSRTYPSLVRDLEFYLRLKESSAFEAVIYDLDADLRGETDVTVKFNEVEYGLQLRVDSKNSDKWYEIKQTRDNRERTIELIDMPLKLSRGNALEVKTSGETLYLYPEGTIKKLIKSLKKKTSD